MSGIGGEIGGKIGNTQNPLFQSGGGITPQQQALAQYDYGQSLLEGAGAFEGADQGGGISDSTMATQVAGGANVGKALTEAGLSDTNQNAQYKASEVANQTQATNQQNALNQVSALGKLAGQLGGTGTSAGLTAGLTNPLGTT